MPVNAPGTITLSLGRGQLVRLPRPITDIFVASETIADVQVRSPTMVYVFAKGAGQTTVSATDKAGVVWSATVRVGQNITSVGDMLHLAMPDAAITATPMNGLVLLTGTVATPDDVAEAQRLAQIYVGDAVQVVSRLKTATPQQVNLQVKIAEVSRSFMKSVGVNLLTRDTTGGFQFNVARGRSVGSIGSADTSTFPSLDASSRFGLPAGSISLPFNPSTGDFVVPGTGTKFDFSKLLAGTGTARGPRGQAVRRRYPERARSRRDGRAGDDARQSESHRTLGRDRQLPRGRRDPDPDQPGARRGFDRI